MENQRIIQVEDKVPFNLLVPLSIQHMFAMFGASILVPFIFGINPAVVLFMNGVGTLLFIGVTKGKAPAYLGSSFAFLAPAGVVISNFGYEYALGGFVAVGFCGCILAFIVYKFGTEWIEVVLPPAAMGPVVALIGLELSGSAASNAGLIGSYMNDVNKELWKLGVPAKTQHNEVAPAQHELAPIYEGVNQAVDHNQIVMETLKKVAGRHGMACLLHEKPFAGVNGSGKHDNWSLTADDGTNLLNPGDTPHENIQFLLVLACIIKAVDIHADLLRESASDVGNDHRLGANEAPPAIISIFLGEQLEDVIDQLCSTGEATRSKQGGTLKTGVDILPDLDKDATDRNRTSPFAFTGNKFEFRMVGSSDSIASPNTVLNTIVAEAFKEAADILEKADDFDMAVHDFIKKTLAAHKRIIFNGNGYSDEWVAEAERRGLPNIRSMVDAIPALTTDKAVKLFEAFGVFTKAELESRSEVEYENYSKAINIEARTMYDMASKSIIPAVIKYTTQLAASIGAVKGVCQEADVSTQTELLIETSKLLTGIKTALAHLLEATEKAAAAEGGKGQAVIYHSQVVPAMEALRAPVDQLEMIVDKELWPMPSYGDLIFEV